MHDTLKNKMIYSDWKKLDNKIKINKITKGNSLISHITIQNSEYEKIFR